MQAKRLNSIWRLVLIIALALGGTAPSGLLAQTATDDPPPPHGIRYDAPEYAIDGPYAVGVRYFTIPAETEIDRELTASVWYPALNPDGEAGQIVYDLQFEPGNIPPISMLGHAILNAEPDDSGGPYPLVVYTHAHWSMGQEVPYFTEHLASRGFVVIAADHEDNWSTDLGPLDFKAVIRRPQEVTRQIDYAEQLSAADGDLPGMISTEKVGAAGWSMGGGTSLAVAGARLDLATLRAWCDEDPLHAQTASWACVDVLENEAAMAEFAGLDEIPSGLWPTTKDERIAAAVRLSGSLVWFGSEGLASVDVPVLLMHGGGEAITDPGILMGAPYESVGSERRAEVVFDYAGHTLFFSSCADSPTLAAIGFPMFCSDPVWEMDRGHDLINHFATAFLEAELKGDEAAAAALATENVAVTGVKYRETGYGAVAETTATEPPHGIRFDAPPYAIDGPYSVGVRP
jgi:predicted dienelactone hydrolase